MTECTNSELKLMLENHIENFADFRICNDKAHEVMVEHMQITNGQVARHDKWLYGLGGALVIVNVIFVPIILSWIAKRI